MKQLTEEERQALIDKAENRRLEMLATNPVDQCDRLTVGYGIKHETCGQDAVQAGGTFMVRLRTKEQPYQRRFQVTEQPLNLDTSWVEQPGYIVIENKRQLPQGQLAPKAEKEVHESHRIQVICNDAHLFSIAPGHAFLAELSCNKSFAWQLIKLCSSFGSCPVNLTVFPR